VKSANPTSRPAETRLGTPISKRAMMDAASPAASSYLCRARCCCCDCDVPGLDAEVPGLEDSTPPPTFAAVLGRFMFSNNPSSPPVCDARDAAAERGGARDCVCVICGGRPEGSPAVLGAGGIPTIGISMARLSLSL
jgi:hypothetical protein